MKRIIGIAIIIFVAGCGDTGILDFYDNPVIAHRGAWKNLDVPQNSIASLKHAFALQCHGSEFDVHLTLDDSLVVNHDHHFFGMDIEASTYQELLTRKHPNGESIPTVRAYLAEGMKQTKTKLIYEIKSSRRGKERSLELAQKSVELVKEMKADKWVEYICFDYDVGKKVVELDPMAKVAYLNGDKSPQDAKNDGYSGLNYHYSKYKDHPHWIGEAHELGLTINVWTVNDTKEMRRLMEQNVDYITTDEPELLLNMIVEK